MSCVPSKLECHLSSWWTRQRLRSAQFSNKMAILFFACQTQRETLAVLWAVKRLYLFGSKFKIVTDHKALEYIFKPSASLSKTTSSMLQRWAIQLAAYNFEIQHRAGKAIPHADYLSRYSHHDPPDSNETVSPFIDSCPVSIHRNRLIKETKLFYGSIISALRNGWSTAAKRRFPDIYTRRDEMTLDPDGVILVCERLLIPPACRLAMLQHHHQAHLRRDKMISLGKLLCWWPSICNDIITYMYVRECQACQEKPRTHKQWRPWTFAFTPMQRLHVDYCRPLLGRFYELVAVDAFSRFPEVFLVTSAPATFTKRPSDVSLRGYWCQTMNPTSLEENYNRG